MDRTATQWLIASTRSSVDSTATTTLTARGDSGGEFTISCNSKGERSYTLRTPFVTSNGSVDLRVGSSYSRSDVWVETRDSSSTLLTPPFIDSRLLKALYTNWDLMAEFRPFAALGFGADGFAAAVDRTRAACNWSTYDFPPDNGWGRPYPDLAPAGAKEASYDPYAREQISVKAWKATNAYGRQQLLVRLNENPSICKLSRSFDGSRFYVEQGGRRSSAVPGFRMSYSCGHKPVTLALQGDFDASLPLTLNVAHFSWHTTAYLDYMSSVSLP
ncbi:hypothetical protein ACS5PK_12275 [Roseateles sp. DB2]|uniref:hypothetical protein n=1 Tax=Roseateles sp. DB2 TaxID=3453717 RepID=UPI003EEF7817